jgi:hypothetical protein
MTAKHDLFLRQRTLEELIIKIKTALFNIKKNNKSDPQNIRLV